MKTRIVLSLLLGLVVLGAQLPINAALQDQVANLEKTFNELLTKIKEQGDLLNKLATKVQIIQQKTKTDFGKLDQDSDDEDEEEEVPMPPRKKQRVK